MATLDPRNNPDHAYQVFLTMPDSEYLGMLASLLNGGVLTPAEEEGLRRAAPERYAER